MKKKKTIQRKKKKSSQYSMTIMDFSAKDFKDMVDLIKEIKNL